MGHPNMETVGVPRLDGNASRAATCKFQRHYLKRREKISLIRSLERENRK